MANYTIPDDPEYDSGIRQLEDTDPARATTVFNPLFQKIINNVHALFTKMADKLHKHSAADITSGTLSVPRGGTGNAQGDVPGNAATATKLATPRGIRVDLGSNVYGVFDGSSNVTPGALGTLPLVRGGTGASNAAAALTSLGAAAATHNHSAADVTSGTLPISRGGTGGSTAADACANIGAISKSGGVITGSLTLTGRLTAGAVNFSSDGSVLRSSADQGVYWGEPLESGNGHSVRRLHHTGNFPVHVFSPAIYLRGLTRELGGAYKASSAGPGKVYRYGDVVHAFGSFSATMPQSTLDDYACIGGIAAYTAGLAVDGVPVALRASLTLASKITTLPGFRDVVGRLATATSPGTPVIRLFARRFDPASSPSASSTETPITFALLSGAIVTFDFSAAYPVV